MMQQRDQWTRWVTRLARADAAANCCNPYAFDWSRQNKARRHNLAAYLREMSALRPKLILVGEALGYRGGRLTGIPFVSTHLLSTHLWYQREQYQPLTHAPAQSEATSTIVHTVLGDLGQRPLLWNAFPFHPHKSNQPMSNRKPTAPELRMGGLFLVDLIDRMRIETVVAVGNSAEKALTQHKIAHDKVRHPSHGGKRDFQTGLEQLINGSSKRCESL